MLFRSSSGFQSAQFRQLEFALGNKNPKFLEYFKNDNASQAELKRLLALPSLYDVFLNFLHHSGYSIPESILQRDFRLPLEPSKLVQDHLVQIYEKNPEITEICEYLVDVDEGLQEWRYRHVKMVERTIGAKIGTGGSAGADYLRRTLFKPLFPDLWIVRTRL